MIYLNNLMNRVDGWGQPNNPETNEPQGVFKRVFATRAATVAFGVPLEVAAVAENVFKATVKGIFIPVRLAVNTFSCLTGSEACEDCNDKLPKVKSFLRAVYRVAAYAIGTFFTLTLGFISPAANFKLHAALGLAENRRERDQETAASIAEAENARKAEEALRQAALKRQAELNLKVEQEKATTEASKKAEHDKAAAEAAKKAEEDKAAAEAAQKAQIQKAAIEASKKAEQDKANAEAARKAAQEKAAAEAAKKAEHDKVVAAEAAKKLELEKAAAAKKVEEDVEVDDIDVEVQEKPRWYKPWTWSLSVV